MPRWGFLASAEFRACIFPVQYPRVHVACSRAYTAHAKVDRIWWNIKVAQRLCGLCGDGADAECMFHWLKNPLLKPLGLSFAWKLWLFFKVETEASSLHVLTKLAFIASNIFTM